ncbi:MAG: PAS domain-containing protein, partial [Thermomicrobiaceae bacterium]|nr:PAS domain-containing protein [Thermomicrobiaceae bacterium]
LHRYVDQVMSTPQSATTEPVAVQSRAGEIRWLEVTVTPLLDANRTHLGISVAFNDVTATKDLEESVQRSKEELETALEELQATVEELETTNEELQSTNEELETTNEELQSTNEELETMNEELQSTNEELETMNEELRLRTTELQQVNAFLESILSSLRAAVVVVDRDLRVYAWNRQAEDLWGLRAEEVRGEHFLNLDIGLPVDQLRQPLRACLSGERAHQEIVLEATNRRGRRVECRVTCSPLLGPARDIRGVILLMEDLSESERGDTTAEG